MRPPVLLVGLLLVAACGVGAVPSTTGPTAPASTAAPVDCPPAPYVAGTLPARVDDAAVPAADLPLDELTSVPGSHSTLWVDSAGNLAVALVRGTLPIRQWPGERGVVSVDGVDAAVGPFGDGTWVAGWYEEPGGRCDLYTMVFYPPVDPAEVEATLASLDRTAG